MRYARGTSQLHDSSFTEAQISGINWSAGGTGDVQIDKFPTERTMQTSKSIVTTIGKWGKKSLMTETLSHIRYSSGKLTSR